MVAINIAAIESPCPLPLRFIERFSPIPPNIQPKSGLKNEQIKPAIAIPFERVSL